MFQFKDKVAVLTGAASGIGRELALVLAERGCRLALADLDQKGLEETVRMAREAGAAVTHRALDVADRKGVERFCRDIINEYGQADILINNAGITLVGKFEDTALDEFGRVMDINFWGCLYFTKILLPHLLERPEARLVNLSSIFGLIGVSLQTSYCASKFAVRGFTESLRREVKGTGLTVMCVHPGGVRTNIARNARYTNTEAGTHDRRARNFERAARTAPQEAAERIVRGMVRRKERLLIGADARFVSALQRLFPKLYGAVVDRIAARSAHAS